MTKSAKGLLVLALALIVVSNILLWFTPWPFSWIVIAASLGLFVLLAIKSELSFDDIGLGRAHLKSGFKYGGVAAIALILAMALAFVVAPEFYQDERFNQSLTDTLLSVLLYLPLRTVLWEEFMFRGLLWGLINKKRGPGLATVLSSIIFGFWHVFAASGSIDSNLLTNGGGNGATIIVATILLTAVAGMALSELRRRSGSLIAPILVHWAANGAGVVLVYAAWS